MARRYHSASSIRLGQRCPRAWAYAYIAGLREPDVDWAEIEAGRIVPPRTRSLSLGKAVHAMGEAYFGGSRAPYAWQSLPGQIFASGIGALPLPAACDEIEVERPIGDVAVEGAPGGRVLELHGVRWAGCRDLAVRQNNAWLQVDYKTTASLARYALTPEALRNDLQCAIYVVDLARRLGLSEVECRWLYLETKAVRRAMPVNVVVPLEHAIKIVEPAAALARELDKLERVEDAEQVLTACYDYGGCQYHASAGGPCETVRSVGAYFEREKGKRTTMALDPALLAKFQALPAPPAPPTAPAPAQPAPAQPTPAPVATFGAPAPAPAPAQPAPAQPAPAQPTPAPVATFGTPAPAPAPAPAERPKRRRPPKAQPEPAPAPEPEPAPAPEPEPAPAPEPEPAPAPEPPPAPNVATATGFAAALLELHAELAEAEAAIMAAIERRGVVLDHIAAAVAAEVARS